MTAETAPPLAPPGTARSRVPLLTAGATFLSMLDSTIANLAIPDLRADFPGSSLAGLTWVITIYAVPFAALLAPAGRLADLIGRRTLFQAGVALFTLASLACALAPTLPVLLVTRGVQGAAAAAMIPASLALLLHDTSPERRARAVGLWTAASASAAAVGPSLGGVLVDAFGWRALFIINVPVGIAMVAAGVRLPRSAAAGSNRPDLLGTVLLGGGVGALALGVTQSDEWGWGDARTIAMLAGGALMVALALWRSARHPVPALEISLWRSRPFAAANASSFLYGMALYTWMLLGVLVLTGLWHYSVLRAGFATTPGAVGATAGAVLTGKFIGRLGPRLAVTGGAFTMVAGGIWIILALDAEPAFLTFWLPGSILVGLGMGAVGTGTASAAALSVSPLRYAGATGLNTTGRQLGGAFGIAILAALLPTVAALDDYVTVYVFATLAALGAGLAGLLLNVRAKKEAS
ncbi:DHA2 family efflux MFS transporter permease subunit [Actinomadura barringtoniae]|uniref:DHA2 family efflux MFS transporter permease subunit n=1 Tax=Actinomadura barringtoniae TaxID=1427535 RepID=A0A939T7H8_9ACTN|nr:DHA2 family efflux MFS transporter permease subunit [Actinomadura barringtoniae]MBO2453128.1 DHA2 family efflux MFS transporter permease subunit [Actinomadura barringtoniae]